MSAPDGLDVIVTLPVDEVSVAFTVVVDPDVTVMVPVASIQS